MSSMNNSVNCKIIWYITALLVALHYDFHAHTHTRILHTHSAYVICPKLRLMFSQAWINVCATLRSHIWYVYVRVIHSVCHRKVQFCLRLRFPRTQFSNRMAKSELISRQTDLLEIFFFSLNICLKPFNGIIPIRRQRRNFARKNKTMGSK